MKLRQTSIAGIIQEFNDRRLLINSNDIDIGTLNGDATVAGSILKMRADSDTYAESLFGTIDLSQVETNRIDISIIDGSVTTDGSFRKAIDDARINAEAITAMEIGYLTNSVKIVTDGIAVLNGPLDQVGSVDYLLAQVVDGAPEEMDTLGEIASRLLNEDSLHIQMINTISENKTNNATALATWVTAFNDTKTADATKFLDEANITQTNLNDALATFEVENATLYYNYNNALSEVGDVANQAKFRENIGAIDATQLATLYDENKAQFFLKQLVVTNGYIDLGAGVAEPYVDYVYIQYPDNEFDEVDFKPDVNVDGRFVINDIVDGDLDGMNVFVKYTQFAA